MCLQLYPSTTPRSSRFQMFSKIDVLNDFANFTEKHLCWRLFLKNLQAYLFLQNISGGCFWTPPKMFSCEFSQNTSRRLLLKCTFSQIRLTRTEKLGPSLQFFPDQKFFISCPWTQDVNQKSICTFCTFNVYCNLCTFNLPRASREQRFVFSRDTNLQWNEMKELDKN